jgi:hypothetical protein
VQKTISSIVILSIPTAFQTTMRAPGTISVAVDHSLVSTTRRPQDGRMGWDEKGFQEFDL